MSAPGAQSLPWPELARGEPGPVYGLISPEPFLLSEALEVFYSCPAFGPNRELNIERFVAGQNPVARVIEAARTLPFLGERRLVVLLELEGLGAKDQGLIVEYIADPTPSTTLVLAGSRLDMRTRLAKALKATGRLHTIPKLYPDKLPGWLEQRAALRGKHLHPRAARALAELAPAGLGALDGEVEKLAIYVGERREITLEDVQEVVGRTRLAGIFELTDAVAAGELARAMEAWAGLKAAGEAPAVAIAMLERLGGQMLEALRLLTEGMQPTALGRAMGLPQGAAANIAKAARTRGEQGIRNWLARVTEAEARLKRGEGRDWVIEGLIVELCR